MVGLTATQLAEELGLTKGRVSQLVAAGRLDGCFSGDGRGRRFDLQACVSLLGRNLDAGQMLGNGASTKRRLSELQSGAGDTEPAEFVPRSGTELHPKDSDRYELARIQKVEEEARRLRRANAEAEGTVVLASAVRRQVTQQIGQEIAEFETVMREAARQMADRFGVDYRAARQVLVEAWRAHRGTRQAKLSERASTTEMSDAEQEANF
ncbi:hypothetical protein SAMN06265173_14817 [Thalassovita litoralis]|jgi:hypothetical protein|uniref:Helix-turn-helix domain-containing protein n=1 Tax=Thalassovita litoralis TaxID=1010611 RepID=A0A521FTV8_9RHOB|nr:hypothetical protein [Thalassovita litoralis]SMO98971.1 hypothetical protein SAMN06265173_14817 [Thalassovita litoralis]